MNFSLCTGCAACKNVCGKDAIQMYVGDDGFKYPEINKDKCINCGKCLKVCKSRGGLPERFLELPMVYAMRSRDSQVRLHSTSGGIFSELANSILSANGYVAGAAYKEDWSAGHCMIQDIEDMEKIRRSKYQQSDTGDIYRKVKATLENSKDVLFSGTPCQIGGLKAFLGKEYPRLLTCDFICRGVSSPKIFQKYLDYLRDVYDSDIDYIWMKNKCHGWHKLTTVIGFKNGKRYVKSGLEDSYARLYLQYNVGVRESCYKCQFKGENHAADITLGDFWGLEGTDLDDDLGTSVVICRTQKGINFVDKIKKQAVFKEMNMQDVIKGNPCLISPLLESEINTDLFYNILEKEGYKQAVRWATGEDL